MHYTLAHSINCHSANLPALKRDAMILPYDANPGRIEFRKGHDLPVKARFMNVCSPPYSNNHLQPHYHLRSVRALPR